MEFKIENTAVYGLDKSMIASGNPLRVQMEDNSNAATVKDMERSIKLGSSGVGEGHDQFLTGIIVQFNIYAPLAMWKELQRYHFLDFVSSQSTMHKLMSFDIKEQCVSDTDPRIVGIVSDLIQQYNAAEIKDKSLWRRIVMSIPSGFVLGATMTTNYRQLKTIYLQRKNHKLKEWEEFRQWCEELPYFKELCLK